MKKIVLFICLILLMPLSVNAENKIHSIDIDIYLNEDGSANIKETWDVDGEDGTEWYKVMNNLGGSKLSDFKVSMDGRDLQYKYWNVYESLEEKSGYYGINYTSFGQELCFGKGDYERHTFILEYKLTNFVFNVDDAQVTYFKLIDVLSSVDFDKFSVTLSSYYSFPNTLDVWGYGYEGYAYVEDGKIKMSDNDNDMNYDYVVLLAKFPLNTYTNTYRVSRFKKFDDVLSLAQIGTVGSGSNSSSDSSSSDSLSSSNSLNNVSNSTAEFWYISFVGDLLFVFLLLISIVFPIIIIIQDRKGSRLLFGFGFKDNKKIISKNVPLFRDIPCNKNIYYANLLVGANSFCKKYKKTNIFGAIILKWVKENRISFRNETKGIFKKETSVIDLTRDTIFDNDLEKELFKVMRKASKDGILTPFEFEKWCKNNYFEFLRVFDKIYDDEIKKLYKIGYIHKRKNRKECEKRCVMNDIMYEDSVKLCGLKKYLEEFSNIDTKEVMEVYLWDEYLMFAYLFGIADKVYSQLKNMYPEVVNQINLDDETICLVNTISTSFISSVSSAKTEAFRNISVGGYSSGGGGFSSSGGGGGSFGGGGGGSR